MKSIRLLRSCFGICCFVICFNIYAQRGVKAVSDFYILNRHSLKYANLNKRNLFFVKSIYNPEIKDLKESKQTVIWSVRISEKLLARRGVQSLFDVELAQALQNGMDGVFIDVTDSKFYGNKLFIHLIQAIRLNYPKLIIITSHNPKTDATLSPFVDFILVKGLFSKPNGATRENQDREQCIKLLKKLQVGYPNLKFLILEYVNLRNENRCKQLNAKNKALGFMSSVIEPEEQQ